MWNDKSDGYPIPARNPTGTSTDFYPQIWIRVQISTRSLFADGWVIALPDPNPTRWHPYRKVSEIKPMYLYNSNGLTEAHISPPLLRETSTSRPLPSLIRRLALSAASAPVPDLIAMLRSRSPFPPSSPHPSKPHEAPRLVVASLHVVLTSLS
jgi:hypothetical protein